MDIIQYQRMRSLPPDQVISPQTYSTEALYTGGSDTSASWNPLTSYDKTKDTYDTSSPDYLDRIAAGEIIMNDFRSVEEELIDEIVTYQGENPIANYPGTARRYFLSGNVESLFAPNHGPNNFGELGINIDALANRAILAAHAKIGEPEMLALVSIAEFHKTAATITRLYKAIWTLLRKGIRIRRLLSQGVITAAKAADAWLEVRYGLRPLYYDMINAVEAIKSLSGEERTRVTAYVEDADSETGEGSHYNSYVGNFEYETFNSRKVSASAGVLCRMNTWHNPGIDSFGLGANDWAMSAWELVPFSFVVDWFINVGDYLSAISPKYDIIVLGSWVTIRDEVNQSTRMLNWTHDKSWKTLVNSTCGGAAARFHKLEVNRYANPSLPWFPQFNIRLNWAKVVDILALIKTVNSSRWRI